MIQKNRIKQLSQLHNVSTQNIERNLHLKMFLNGADKVLDWIERVLFRSASDVKTSIFLIHGLCICTYGSGLKRCATAKSFSLYRSFLAKIYLFITVSESSRSSYVSVSWKCVLVLSLSSNFLILILSKSLISVCCEMNCSISYFTLSGYFIY